MSIDFEDSAKRELKEETGLEKFLPGQERLFHHAVAKARAKGLVK